MAIKILRMFRSKSSGLVRAVAQDGQTKTKWEKRGLGRKWECISGRSQINLRRQSQEYCSLLDASVRDIQSGQKSLF